MSTIRATCPHCGDISASSKIFKVRICATNNTAHYTFDCPTCGAFVSKKALPHIIDLLVSAGVGLVTFELPKEMLEARDQDLPPISHDEMLEFHYGIENLQEIDLKEIV